MSADLGLSAVTDEPPVVLDAAFVDRLHGVAMRGLERNPVVANRLLREIERATIVGSADMPPDVVSIGSTVTFRDETDGRIQTVTLVLPSDADIGRRRVSVLTPVGAALVGLAAGASISWGTLTGGSRRLTILGIADPAAA